jgi:hypothetical protein
MARSRKYPLSLDEHRKVGFTVAALRSQLFRIASGPHGGTFRWNKTTEVCRALVKAIDAISRLQLALENETAAQLATAGRSTTAAVTYSCPPQEDVKKLLDLWGVAVDITLGEKAEA